MEFSSGSMACVDVILLMADEMCVVLFKNLCFNLKYS